MKTTLGTLCVLLLAMVLPRATGAAEEKAASRTLDDVLASYLKSVGGRESLEKVKSRVVKATMEAPALGGILSWQVQAKAPDKRLSVLDIPNFGQAREGYDGQVAWAQNPVTGITIKTGDELLKARTEAAFHPELQLKKLFPDLAVKGTAKVGDQETDILEANPSKTSRERFFISRKNGLLLRSESELEASTGRLVAQADFEDYRAVGGIQTPFLIKVVAKPSGQADIAVTIKVTEVLHNVPLDDALFAKPAAQ